MSEAKSNRNARVAWTAEEVQPLRELADGNTPVEVMTIKLGRRTDSIRSRRAQRGSRWRRRTGRRTAT